MDNKRAKKINARVTPQVDRKLREIVAATSSSMSEVIMRAIERYYEQGPLQAKETPYELARRAGVIGVFRSGDGKLSVNYKERLTESLVKKYAGKADR